MTSYLTGSPPTLAAMLHELGDWYGNVTLDLWAVDPAGGAQTWRCSVADTPYTGSTPGRAVRQAWRAMVLSRWNGPD